MRDPEHSPPARAFLPRLLGDLYSEFRVFSLLALLGGAASYLSVNIPHTQVYLDARLVFGFMGFALLGRWWAAVALAGLLAVTGFHQVPLGVCFVGNMLYLLPSLAVIRLSYLYWLKNVTNLALFALGWFLLVLFCYQVFDMPAIWGVVAYLEGKSIPRAVLASWVAQPFWFESIVVGGLSALGMVVVRAYRQIIEAREELAVTLNSIGDGVIATDRQGRVTRMNPMAQRLTGWDLDDALGRDLGEVFHIISSRSGQRVENPVKRVLAQGAVVGLANHTSLVSRDKTVRQIADSAAPIRDAAGELTGAVMVFRDVTAEYAAAEELRRSEERFALAFQTAPWAITITRAADGKFIHVNGAFTAISGYTRAEALADSSIGLSLWANEVDRDQVVATLLGGGEVVGQEFSFRRKNGEIFPGLFSAQLMTTSQETLILSSINDITERKKFVEALRASETKYRNIFQNAPLGLFRAAPGGKFIEVNPALAEMLGYDSVRQAIEGRHGIGDHILPKGEERERVLMDQLGATGVMHYQNRYRRRDGSEFMANVHLATVRDRDKKPLYLEGIVEDITEQRRMREEKARLEEQFQKSQKLESIGRLAGGVAHDLNNLLSPILGYGEMLMEDAEVGEGPKVFLGEIVRAGGRAQGLVSQLLAFSRRQVLAFKPLDLNEILAGFKTLLRRTIREDVAIEFDLAPALPLVLGDAGQLEQVIMNLAANAQDAMPSGGILTIETREVELDEDYAAARDGVAPGRYVMLSFSDTGRGMDEQTRQRLFEPFFSTKGRDRGTGLGLATVYGIVKQHEGNIWVYSEPGRGATFKIYLPVSCQEGHPPREPAAREPARLTGSETILLAEDNEQVRSLCQIILLRQGYRVLAAANGTEAVRALEHHAGKVHLLLTDVVMPDMSGRDLYHLASQRLPGLKVIYMSGYTDNVIVHRGVLDEDVSFLQKPFSVRSLAAKVRQVLDGQ